MSGDVVWFIRWEIRPSWFIRCSVIKVPSDFFPIKLIFAPIFESGNTKVIRERTPFVDKDRIMYKDINICEDIIKENLLVEAVEKAIGKELLVGEEIVSDLKL